MKKHPFRALNYFQKRFFISHHRPTKIAMPKISNATYTVSIPAELLNVRDRTMARATMRNRKK